MLSKIYIFILGSIVGSFLNVCIYRLPKGGSVVSPRSFCPHCKKPILWYDNIPIISFVLLGSRCRHCKGKISFMYPLVEILTAALFLALFIYFGITAKFFAYAVLVSGLMAASFVDFKIQEIPDEVSVGGIAVGLIASFLFPILHQAAGRMQSGLSSMLGIIAGGLSIYLLGVLGKMLFKKEAMGGGDVKLMAMIGSFIGWKMVIITFFIAPVFASIVGIILKFRYGRETIPYGPYLSLAAVISIFWGEKLLRMFI